MASSNVRDVVQTVIDGLVVKGTLPDGNWQQVAAHLAAPGQQQILQLLQQIQTSQAQMQGDIAAMKGDIAAMKGDIAAMKGDITAMNWNQVNSAIR
jgi:hypothetical protein